MADNEIYGAGASFPDIAEAPKVKQKKRKTWIIPVAVAVLAIVIPLVVFLVILHNPKFTVDDAEFTMNYTVKEIRETGLVLCGSDGTIKKAAKSLYPHSYLETKYHIGKKISEDKALTTGFVIQVGNFSGNTKPLEDCTLYRVWYYPEYHSKELDVRIDGQDFSNAARNDDLKDLLKASGIPFDDADINAFIDGGTDELKYFNSMLVFKITPDTNHKDSLLFTVYRNKKVSK